MAWSLLNTHKAEAVKALLDDIDKGNEGRADMENRAMDRQRAESIIHAVIWAYSCRSSDTAGAYAMEAFRTSVGRDLANHLVHGFEFDDKSAALRAAQQ